MKFTVVIAVAAAGCGNDIGHPQDDPQVDALVLPPGTPLVTVSAPRLNESFYMTQTIQVAWVASKVAAMTCDVVASDGSTTVPIAANVAASDGAALTADWVLTSVSPGASYRVEVTCRNDASPTLIGTGTSATFSVTGPPQQVSYASQVQPLWAACTGAACHDNTVPQAGLNLTSTSSYGALVGMASTQCPSTQRVTPGAPDQSYLVFKLQGSGPCLIGTRMPKAATALTAAQLQLVRDWIANGAVDN